MIAVENITLKQKILDGLVRERKTGSKMHVTELVCCVRKTILNRRGVKELLTEGSILSMSEGRGSHAVIEEVFKASEERVELDDVVGTIDAVGERITEIYTTSYSSKNTLQELIEKSTYFKLKMKQIMAYCKMKGVKEADLVILFRFGDYRERKPKLACYTLLFSEEELERNWNTMVEKRKKILEWEGKEIEDVNQLPADPVEGECEECGYHYICPEAKNFTAEGKEEVF
jgi:CRISPR/Cas system-associated exonuclease Cas4 (RecB family)